MARLIMTPDRLESPERALFLAGGVTGCPDWQSEMIQRLSHTCWTLLNPRHARYFEDLDWSAEQQIAWEFEHLRLAEAVLFWFPCETVCPITLFELGAWSMTGKSIFVGVHPEYSRREDIDVQMRLLRPELRVVLNLTDLAAQASGYLEREL
ncbi:MAG: nucleoside 2-deoxyribosyltransferase domain-containing protein [Capsulimonas sp.]|uniref:nucleoside 2-deoxyribosyltransferase domain-containing protein n=1 Tax=Capsulimonas sp. TaxID=2494211 RepID=UPI0032631702